MVAERKRVCGRLDGKLSDLVLALFQYYQRLISSARPWLLWGDLWIATGFKVLTFFTWPSCRFSQMNLLHLRRARFFGDKQVVHKTYQNAPKPCLSSSCMNQTLSATSLFTPARPDDRRSSALRMTQVETLARFRCR